MIDREEELRRDPVERRRLEMAERYAREMVRAGGAVADELTIEMQTHFRPDELSDLIFAIGYHIGMQYIGRAMHWDDACPVPLGESTRGHG